MEILSQKQKKISVVVVILSKNILNNVFAS